MSTNDQFAQRVADTAYDDIEAEFIARGEELGLDVQPLAEIANLEQAREERRPVVATGTDGATRPAGRSRPQPIPPGRNRPQPVPPARRTQAVGGASGAPANKRDKNKRREYRVVQVREPVDFWIEPSEEDLAQNPDAQAELMTVYVRRTPTQEIPYLDRYEAMLIRLRHIMTDIKVDGPKAQNRLDKLAGEYNQLMEEMIMFSVDMPEGGYFRLDAAALNYLQNVIRELSRAQQTDDDDDDDGQGNW